MGEEWRRDMAAAPGRIDAGNAGPDRRESRSHHLDRIDFVVRSQCPMNLVNFSMTEDRVFDENHGSGFSGSDHLVANRLR